MTIRKLTLTVIIFVQAASLFSRDYNITDFGAVKGKLSTTAIQKAVDECFAAGGGRVVIPPGIFITGSIILKSNVSVYLENGSVLKGSDNIEDYRANDQRYGILFAEDACNISICGNGTIDANGSHFYDFTKNHIFEEFDRNVIRQRQNYMKDGTFFSDGPVKRISMPGMTIMFFHCTRVSLTGIRIKDTPVYAALFGYCEDVIINGITIRNNILIPNSDGIHCTASRNIRISNCDIVAGDDAIVMTGFDKNENRPGYSMDEQENHKFGNKSIYAENMNVTNCQLKSTSSGIRIGYGQHPICRCIFSNITIYDSHRGIGIFAHDSANIEELSFDNILIETRLYNGQWWGHGEPIHLSCISRFPGHQAGQIKNITFSNITATGEQGILVFGLKDSQIEDIRFNNVQLYIKKGKETMDYGGNFDLRPAAEKKMQIFEHDIPGLYAQYVTNLFLDGFHIEWDPLLPDFFTNAIEVNEFTNLSIDRLQGEAAPNSKDKAAIKLSNGIGFQIINSTYKGTKPLIIKSNVKLQ